MTKFLLMGGVLLVVLGGGGVGVYLYFNKAAEASAVQGDEVDKAAQAGHGEAASGEEGAVALSQFVELDPLILPIVDSEGVSQVLNLVIAIEVADQAAADEVERLSPRLKDAYITELYGVLNKEAAMHNGVVQVGAIKKKLADATAKVMGEGVAKNVLLQVVQQRPI